MVRVTTSQPRVGAVPWTSAVPWTNAGPWTLLAVGGGSMRAVLRLVDERLAEQAARNAAGCLEQRDRARREHDLTVADLRRLEQPDGQGARPERAVSQSRRR